jgi:uncharacterized protein YdaU (DUF1376 family)
MPLYTDAFIADTVHLSATETGAYLMLLMCCWREPQCRLADCDADLARFARLDVRAWRRIKPRVMAFWTLEAGYWTQKRCASERELLRKRAAAARENGATGGRPKSLKAHDTQNPAGSVSETQPKAPISISNKEIKNKEMGEEGKPTVKVEPHDPRFRALKERFRRERGRSPPGGGAWYFPEAWIAESETA